MADASVDLFASFKVGILFSGGPEQLKAEFFVGFEGTADLFAEFEVYPTANLFAKFNVAQPGSQDLFCKCRVMVHFTEGWADIKGIALITRADSADLLGEFIVRQEGSVEGPKGIFTVRWATSLDLFAETIIRHSASQDLLAELIVRHSDSRDLSAEFTPRRSASLNLYATFEAMPNVNLKGIFVIKHTATPLNLLAKFWVRFPYRLWTNRRYINGVIEAAEDLIGDAVLEYVIEGVMEDIQTWMLANRLNYDDFTDITLCPVALRRATTYGVVASLFARKTKTFKARVIPFVAPVAVTVKGDDQVAMEYWEGKYEEMLELYLTTTGTARLWVSTEDEEPVFSMEDIPPTVEDLTEWHEWLRQRET